MKTGVVGLGTIAAEHLRKLRWMPDVRVVGVCDQSRSLAEAVAERFEVGPAFTSAEEMLERTRPDVVHVLTPPQTHRALVLEALAHGAHVLVEKPIATTWNDYTAMRDAAAAAGRMLIENYNYRFTDVVLEAIERQHSGAIGSPVTLDVSMTVGLADPAGPYVDRVVPHFGHALPGGAMFNFATHPSSVVAAMIGRCEKVGVWSGQVSERSLSDDELRALVAKDDVSAIISLTSNARPSSFTIAVLGTEGTLSVDVFNRRLFQSTGAGGLGRLTEDMRHAAAELRDTLALAGRYATGRHDYFAGLRTLLERFYAAVAGRADPPIPTAEMDATNALVHAMFDPENRL